MGGCFADATVHPDSAVEIIEVSDGISAREFAQVAVTRGARTVQDALDGGLFTQSAADIYQRRLAYNGAPTRTGQHQRSGLAADGAQDGLGLTLTRSSSDGLGVFTSDGQPVGRN